MILISSLVSLYWIDVLINFVLECLAMSSGTGIGEGGGAGSAWYSG